MVAEPKRKWTVEEYLAFERESEEKHEYIDGEVVMMVGGSTNHSLIIGNTYASIHSQLRQKPCLVYTGDVRVKITQTHYTYPDVTVICGTPELEDGRRDTLLNPLLLVEVLSPSTESYDRGLKFQRYRTLKSLQTYVLISQNRPDIEVFMRTSNDLWLLADATDLDGRIELASIGCTLALADVYEKITFEE
jgi:Uma2 family endonuclease